MPAEQPLVFFDLETGGLRDDSPDIQIAAIAVDSDFNEIASFERKIQFDEATADQEALKLNHYQPEEWKAFAKPAATVVREFSRFLSDNACIQLTSKKTGNPYKVARLAGHNVQTFDMPRLRRMFGTTFMPAHPQPLDTLALAMWYFRAAEVKPANNKLSTLCEHLKVPIDGAHDALADVRMSAALAKQLCAVLR